MLTPSADRFVALARSSPWRWSTVRFTVRWTLPHPTWPEPVRAWIRRPDALRVEQLDGSLLHAGREQPRTVGVPTGDGGYTRGLPWAGSAQAPAPLLGADGLVRARPSESGIGFDDPMFQDYRWVAMLDPVELADGEERLRGVADGDALVVDTVAEVEHGGRQAWEAVVRPTPSYEPRCGCCSLLRTREVDIREEAGGGPNVLLAEYPEAFRVRLDVQSGVCVLTEQIGGRTPGAGHDLRIEAVDEPMGDELFAQPRPRFLRRRG